MGYQTVETFGVNKGYTDPKPGWTEPRPIMRFEDGRMESFPLTGFDYPMTRTDPAEWSSNKKFRVKIDVTRYTDPGELVFPIIAVQGTGTLASFVGAYLSPFSGEFKLAKYKNGDNDMVTAWNGQEKVISNMPTTGFIYLELEVYGNTLVARVIAGDGETIIWQLTTQGVLAICPDAGTFGFLGWTGESVDEIQVFDGYTPPAQPNLTNVVLYGDSVTAEDLYPKVAEDVATAYRNDEGRFERITRGFPGRTSGALSPQTNGGEPGVLTGTIAAMTGNGATIVCLKCGANDSKVGIRTTKLVYAENLRKTIRAFIAAGCTHFILLPPETPGENAQGTTDEWDAASHDLIVQYRAATQEIPLEPEWAGKVYAGSLAACTQIDNRNTLLGDGVHPNSDPTGTVARLIGVAAGLSIAAALGLIPAVGSTGGGSGATPQEIAEYMEREGGLLDLIAGRVLLALPPDAPGTSGGVARKQDVTTGSTTTQILVAFPLRVTDWDGSPVGTSNNARITMTQGDTAPARQVQLVDGNSRPIPLTEGTTVEYRLRQTGGAFPEDGAKTITAPAVITSAVAGIVQYSLADDGSDTDTPGLYEESWRVTMPGGRVTTFPGEGRIVVEIKAA